MLVVDDQALAHEAIVATSEHEPGFTVAQGGSLTEARPLLDGVEIAFLDHSLPDGDGADLIDELHAANPNAAAVVLTSSIDPDEAAQARRRGAAAVLNKLDHLDQLLPRIGYREGGYWVHAAPPRGPRVAGWVISSLAPEEIAGLGFEAVVRHAPVAISVIAASGRVIYSNARLRDLISRQLGDEMPADLDGGIDIFHPDGRRYDQREWPAVRSITSGEEIAEEEFFYALPDRQRLFIRCSSSPVRDEHGEIVAAVLSMTDITERKRQEERLTYLAGLLDNTDDGVVAMDERYFLTVWNHGAERLYGWKAAEPSSRMDRSGAARSRRAGP